MPRHNHTETRERQARKLRHGSNWEWDPKARATAHQEFQAITAEIRRRRMATPPRTAALTAGTVVWATVSFAQGDGEKDRPAVVLSSTKKGIRAMGLSSVRPGRLLVPLATSEPFLPAESGCQLVCSWVDRVNVLGVAGHLNAANLAVVNAVVLTQQLVDRLSRASRTPGPRPGPNLRGPHFPDADRAGSAVAA